MAIYIGTKRIDGGGSSGSNDYLKSTSITTFDYTTSDGDYFFNNQEYGSLRSFTMDVLRMAQGLPTEVQPFTEGTATGTSSKDTFGQTTLITSFYKQGGELIGVYSGIYIDSSTFPTWTKINGGTDASTLKLATNYDPSTQLYSIPVFCSSTNSNLISPLIDTTNEDYYNSLRIIPIFNNDSICISNINNSRLYDALNINNQNYPGIQLYYGSGATIIASETGVVGDTWFSVTPIWDGGYIQCKLWDGYKNDASSSKRMWYYSDTHTGYLYPQIYTTSGESNGDPRTISYINTILDLVNDESIDTEAATINLNAYSNNYGSAALIVRESADIVQFASDTTSSVHRSIVYGPNFSENAAKGASGDPSIIVCYSFLFTKSYILVNAAQYKEA